MLDMLPWLLSKTVAFPPSTLFHSLHPFPLSSPEEKSTTNVQGFECYLWQSVTLHSVPP